MKNSADQGGCYPDDPVDDSDDEWHVIYCVCVDP